MKNQKTLNPFRRIASHFLVLFAMSQLMEDGTIPYWDHSITGRLGDRSRWGFDVHKYHLKSVKNRRRTNRN